MSIERPDPYQLPETAGSEYVHEHPRPFVLRRSVMDYDRGWHDGFERGLQFAAEQRRPSRLARLWRYLRTLRP